MDTRTLIDDVNTKTARAVESIAEYAEAGKRVAQAVAASLEVVAKWGGR